MGKKIIIGPRRAKKGHGAARQYEAAETNVKAIWEPFELEVAWGFPVCEPRKSSDFWCCEHVAEGCIPISIVAYNEAGFNSVGICAHCLADLLRELGVI